MTVPFADIPAAADLLDVFSTYDGPVIFRGLTEAGPGGPPVLGRIGWIFTGFGALLVLWGFVLRAQGSGGDRKLGEVVRTWVVIAFMVSGPFLMRTAMQSADSVYDASVGGPRNLTLVCVKAAYAMPELNTLFDVLRRGALAGSPDSLPASHASRQALIGQANDGSVMGYLEALGVAVWDTAADYGTGAAASWNTVVRMAAMAAGMGSAMLKCLLIALTILPLYLLLLLSAAIVWFMEQLRYFLAVTGSMMLPLFVGMFSLPEGHFSRQTANAYVMNMVSLALWPVAWAIGHTGTVALYNALISLVAGTSRVPEIAAMLQWDQVSSGVPTEAQLRATEAALGNWFMGNLTGLLSLLVGGLGFLLWVGVVSILGPVYLHKLLATGALFMTQAVHETGIQTLSAGRLALSLSQNAASGLLSSGASAGERLSSAPAVPSASLVPGGTPWGRMSGAPLSTMEEAAGQVDDSDGKGGRGL